jgi:hypothetical protein
MDPLTFEEKCKVLEDIGVEPNRLKQMNPLFFNRIMERICQFKQGKTDYPLQHLWITCGDEEYYKTHFPKEYANDKRPQKKIDLTKKPVIKKVKQNEKTDKM